MNARSFGRLLLLLSGTSALWSIASAAPPGVPGGAPAPAATPAAKPPAPKAKPAPAVVAAEALDTASLARGVVVLERAGRPIGLGAVMNGDGRIVTALSALGDARNVDARYTDGSVVPTRLGHAAHVRDLALLVPQSGRQRQGLRAARDQARADAPLRAFTNAGTKAVLGAPLTPGAAVAVSGADGKPLADAITFAALLPPSGAGAPLIDDKGEVRAIVTRAFKRAPSQKPTPVLVGTPVTVVRDFLRTAPASAALPATGIGIRGEAVDAGVVRGVRVTEVRGPAAVAGLRAGKDLATSDVIVALDGAPVITPDALSAALSLRVIGDPVDLIVLSPAGQAREGARYRHVTLVVARAP